MDRPDGPRAAHRQERVDALLDVVGGFLERGVVGRDLRQRVAGQVVADRVRDDEIAVREPLHQRAGAEAVGAVIGEVRFAEHVQAGDVAHQVVVHPQAAHRVVDGGVDAHRRLVRILVGDLLVHLEEVAVLLLDDLDAEAGDGVPEIEIDGQPGLADATALVADLLDVARGDVARDEIAEARILPFEEVVALVLGNLFGRTLVAASSSAPRRGRRCAGSRSSASASTDGCR